MKTTSYYSPYIDFYTMITYTSYIVYTYIYKSYIYYYIITTYWFL